MTNKVMPVVEFDLNIAMDWSSSPLEFISDNYRPPNYMTNASMVTNFWKPHTKYSINIAEITGKIDKK